MGGNTFTKKPAHKNQSVSPLPVQSSPQKQAPSLPVNNPQPVLQNIQKAPVPASKKKGLFDDDDDDDGGFLSKKPAPKTSAPVQQPPPQMAATKPAATQAKKKNLF